MKKEQIKSILALTITALICSAIVYLLYSVTN